MYPFSKYLSYETYQKLKDMDDIYFKSIILVRMLFKNRTDKFGYPYIYHLLSVSDSMTTIDGKVLGLLHDTVEDIDGVTFDDLVSIGIHNNIIDALRLITKEKTDKKLTKEEKLSNYNRKIDEIIASNNDLALELKIADISNNYDEDRMKNLPLEMQEWFTKKYKDNLIKLKETKEKRMILC